MKGKYRIMLVVAGLLLALALPVLGCGGDSPSVVAERFVTASADLDCDTLVELMSNDSVQLFGEDRGQAVEACKEQLAALGEGAPNLEVTSFEVTEENIDGDTATVDFKASAKIEGEETEQTQEDTVNLVKEDGKWKVSVG